MIDLDDLRNLCVCEKCKYVFMPSVDEIESPVITRYCKVCKKCHQK